MTECVQTKMVITTVGPQTQKKKEKKIKIKKGITPI